MVPGSKMLHCNRTCTHRVHDVDRSPHRSTRKNTTGLTARQRSNNIESRPSGLPTISSLYTPHGARQSMPTARFDCTVLLLSVTRRDVDRKNPVMQDCCDEFSNVVNPPT